MSILALDDAWDNDLSMLATAPVGQDGASEKSITGGGTLGLLRERFNTLLRAKRASTWSKTVAATLSPNILEFLQPAIAPQTDYWSAGATIELLGALKSEPIEQLFVTWQLPEGMAIRFRDRLALLAKAMRGAGLANGTVYAGPEDEVIAEFGPINRALTFILDETQTLTMFRSGPPDDFGKVAMVRLAAMPTALELEQVANDYFVSIICQRPKTKVTSHQTVSLAAA